MRSKGGGRCIGAGSYPLWTALLIVVAAAAAAPCRADADRSVLEAGRRATGFVFAEFKDSLSMGTGFCIDSSGLFVTNNHVIAEKGSFGRIRVVLAPGTRAARVLGATVVKADADMDLAILRVDRPNNLHAVELAGAGRLGRLRETQEVMALGYPFGLRLAAAAGAAPEVSVSTGRITALRHVKGQLAVIQFDGSINHGNSGGPLLDRSGNVIGVVSAIIPDKQINFAIPVSLVQALLAEANIVIAPAALGDAQTGREFVDSLVAPPKGRRAAPDAAAQRASLKLVHDLFASDYADKSRAGQQALVYELLDESQKEKDDPSSRFALLSEAREAAIRAGDFPAALVSTGELIDAYDVRSIDLVVDLVRRTGPRLGGQDAADGATVSLLLVEAFARQQAFAEARKWVPSTRAIAYASHNPKVVSAVGERIARVEFLANESERGQAALARLKADPNDADANLAAGRYHCFVRGDFAAGCACLAKGGGAAAAGLKQAAAAELARPGTPADQKACGDLWWDAATAESKAPVAADACRARAVDWYRQAEPKLTGLARRAVEQRLEEAGAEPEPTSAAPKTATVARRDDHKIRVTNRTAVHEAQDVIDAVAAKYPQAVTASATYELVKVHDAGEFRRNGGAGPRDVPDTYGDGAVAGKAGGPMLWGIYEKWDAGHYLIVYRVQALSDVSGDNVCFLDVCTSGRTIAKRLPAASEFNEGDWSCMPIELNLDTPRELEFRLWPQNHAIAIDRVYIFRMN